MRPSPSTKGAARAARPARLPRGDTDARIRAAAAEVLLADPRAPVSAVARRAGVGMSALYSRYRGKDDLLRRLCHDGLRGFIAAADAPSRGDPWEDLSAFLRRVIAADVHALTIHLAGTFAPTAEMRADAQRANSLASQLLDRARKSGQVRPGISLGDLQLVLEACSSIRLPDEGRAAVMRQRLLAMLLEGWRAGAKGGAPADLPGPAPTPEEINWRWQPARR